MPVARHVLVPKHEIVSQRERTELIKKYGPLRLFPKISAKDPQVRALGAKIGDLVRITRKSKIAGESIYYRVVRK